jgi:hypothetical protein
MFIEAFDASGKLWLLVGKLSCHPADNRRPCSDESDEAVFEELFIGLGQILVNLLKESVQI